MNILPLVTAFILIFSIGCYTFSHNQLCSIQEREHFFGAITASHCYARSLQTKRFRKIKGENLAPKSQSDEEIKNTDYHSPRDRQYPYHEAKLNIASMIGSDTPELDTLFIDFINHLYSFFIQEELQKPGDLILKLIKKTKRLENLEELIELSEEKDKEIVYKILKGTQNVELNRSIGYPALGDYIYIGKKQQKRGRPVHICYAARPLLEVLCGTDIAEKIIEEEKMKWEPKHTHNPIKRDELTRIFLSRDQNLSTIENFIDFSRKKGALQEEVIEAAGIKIRHLSKE